MRHYSFTCERINTVASLRCRDPSYPAEFIYNAFLRRVDGRWCRTCTMPSLRSASVAAKIGWETAERVSTARQNHGDSTIEKSEMKMNMAMSPIKAGRNGSKQQLPLSRVEMTTIEFCN